MLTLILGGARSGKSRTAQRLAAQARCVTYIVTLQAGDDPEMTARIARHRADRPASWNVIEEPVALACSVEGAAPSADVIVVDCLTIWLANLFWQHREDAPACVEEAAKSQLARIAAVAQKSHVILVSNEVGCAIVPEAALARDFRDAQGLVNQCAAEAAEEVILTVAGLPLYLKKRDGRVR